MSRRVTFVCDDRAGFELTILQADDGDFHAAVQPVAADFKREHHVDLTDFDNPETKMYSCLYMGAMRVRAPMVGGGAHAELWHALANLFKALAKAGKLTEVPR